MNDILLYGGLYLLGGALGFIYYGGLWLTLNRLESTRYPAILTIASFVLRLVLAAGGFLFFMRGEVLRLLAMLLGFITLRFILVKLIGRSSSMSWTSILTGDVST